MGNASEEPEDMSMGAGIMVDESSNSLIIHAPREDVKKIMSVIRQLDRPMKQVLIEAHIVEAESNTGKELGVQWGGLVTSETSNGKSYFPLGVTLLNLTPQCRMKMAMIKPINPLMAILSTCPSVQVPGMSWGVMAQKVGEYVLYAQLLALEEEGKLNILSKPSITTMDHRKAVIKSGKEVPFQTVENDEVNIEWKEAVIKLEVTPHVINDNIVRLEILTHKDELDFTDAVNGNPNHYHQKRRNHGHSF